MRSNVLITGVAGFIGSHTAERFLRAGWNVVGIDSLDPYYSVDLKKRNLGQIETVAKETGRTFEWVQADILDLVSEHFSEWELDGVIHLAAKAGVRPSIEDPMGYAQANVSGTVAVLEFCRKRGIERLVFGSSSSVYGNNSPVPFQEDAPADFPISPYGASKRSGELYCRTYAHLYGIKIAALRFFTVYGPRQRPDLAINKFANLIAKNEPVFLFGDGTTQRDYTFVSDITAGIFKATEWLKEQDRATFEIFNLGGAHVTDLNRLVTLIEKNIGQVAQRIYHPEQPGDVVKTYANTAKAEKLLGYRSEVSIEQGIQKYVEWLKQ